ncbi:hypothetical protein AB0L53_58960 [Nonomuraea sp. NPDC052129]|uniref:hypothetical protein n=1 Tax=unclassified Nonomuraea TaxID=2593643 RepID=UPI0034051C40
MDSEIIATSAATLLATKAWEAYATQAGNAAWSRMVQLANRLRQRLGITPMDNKVQAETIEGVTAQLHHIMRVDNDLSQMARDFLNLTQRNYHAIGIAIGDNARVGKAVYIHNVERDVNF